MAPPLFDLTSRMPFSIFPIAFDGGDDPPPGAPGLDDESGAGLTKQREGNAMMNENIAVQTANLTELNDETLDDLISGGAQELSTTQAWE